MKQVPSTKYNDDQPEKDKDLKKSKIISALGIGFLAGLVIFGLMAAIFRKVCADFILTFPYLLYL